jgi:hypothetical protein
MRPVLGWRCFHDSPRRNPGHNLIRAIYRFVDEGAQNINVAEPFLAGIDCRDAPEEMCGPEALDIIALDDAVRPTPARHSMLASRPREPTVADGISALAELSPIARKYAFAMEAGENARSGGRSIGW